jgi:hypothetical protein
LAAIAVPNVAWAPPICHRTLYHREQLTLRVRQASIDGVAAPVPDESFALTAGCPPASLVAALYDPDPDVPDGQQTLTLVQSP